MKNKNQEQLRILLQELRQTVGNKVYFRNLENLFEKFSNVEITGEELHALRLLSCDLRFTHAAHQREKNKPPYFRY